VFIFHSNFKYGIFLIDCNYITMNNSSGHKTLVPNFKKKYFLWLIVIGDDSKSSFFIQIYLQSSLIKTLRYILKKIT